MKRFIGIVSIVFLGCSHMSPRPSSGNVTVHEFSNGLTLIAIENHAHPVVALSAFVTTGGRTEAPEWSGSLHYIEHLVYKGNTKNYKPTEFRKLISEIAAEAGGWTWDDEINFGFEAPKANFKRALGVFTESLLELRFEKDWFEAEKNVVLQEMEKDEEQPSYQVYYAWQELAWKKHAYGRRVIGTQQTVKNLDLALTEKYYRERFSPNHIVLCAVGDFSQDEIRDTIAGEWLRFDRGPKSFELGVNEPPQTEPRSRALESKEAHSARFLTGFRTVPGKDADTVPLSVLAALLNSPTVGLPRYLVRDQKLVVSVSVSSTPMVDDGIFQVESELEKPDQLKTIAAWVEDHLVSLNVDGFSDESIDRAKRQLLTDRAMSRETFAEQAERLGFEYERLGRESALSYDERLRAITREDLKRVAQKYFKREKLVTVTLTPPEPTFAAPITIDHAPRQEPTLPKIDTTAVERPLSYQVVEEREGIRVVRLENGLTVAVYPTYASNIVSVDLRIFGGQWAEPPGQEGINRFAARMLLRGTRHWTREEFDALQAQYGVSLSTDHESGSRANTAIHVDYRDSASIEFRATPDTLLPALVLLREAVFFPRFDEKEIESLRKDVLNEIGTLSEDRLEFIKQEFYDRAYRGHPYGRPTIGTKESIQSLTRVKLVGFHSAHVTPSAVCIVLVGPVDADRLVDWFRSTSSRTKASEPRLMFDAKLPDAKAVGEPQQVVEAGASQWTLNFGGPCLEYGDTRQPIARLLFRTLGNRHFYKYVYERGVSYRSWFNLWGHFGPSPWIVENDVKKDRFEEIEKEIVADIAAYAKGDVSNEEIEKSRSRMVTSLILAKQKGTWMSWTIALAAQNHAMGRGRGLKEFTSYIDEISSVKADDVRALAKELLSKPYLRLIVK